MTVADFKTLGIPHWYVLQFPGAEVLDSRSKLKIRANCSGSLSQQLELYWGRSCVINNRRGNLQASIKFKIPWAENWRLLGSNLSDVRRSGFADSKHIVNDGCYLGPKTLYKATYTFKSTAKAEV